MRVATRVGTVLIAAAMLTACGDSTAPKGVTLQDLVGTWNATSWQYTDQANAGNKIDLVSEGTQFTLVVASSGQFTLTEEVAPGFTLVITGNVAVQGSNLVLSDPAAPGQSYAVPFTLVGSVLTITDDEESFDFDSDGTEEAATLVQVYQKL